MNTRKCSCGPQPQPSLDLRAVLVLHQSRWRRKLNEIDQSRKMAPSHNRTTPEKMKWAERLAATSPDHRIRFQKVKASISLRPRQIKIPKPTGSTPAL
ncbi:hypothetical protein U1Q18_018611 [Sarracenia purpurea var. burkii]